MTSASTLGLVFAGGDGSRLGGVDKALLRLGHRTLLDLCLESLAPDVDRILVARKASDAVLPSTTEILVDRADSPRGPAAALWALTRLCASLPDSVLVLTTAVDTPLLPPDYGPRLKDRMAATGASAVIGAWNGNAYFTQALWRLCALRRACDALGPARAPALSRLFPCDTVTCDFLGSFNPFANVNTLADLRALARSQAP